MNDQADLIYPIRNHLIDNFTTEQISFLCYDYADFLPFYDTLPHAKISKLELINRLIQYAKQTSLLEPLLKLVIQNSSAPQPNMIIQKKSEPIIYRDSYNPPNNSHYRYDGSQTTQTEINGHDIISNRVNGKRSKSGIFRNNFSGGIQATIIISENKAVSVNGNGLTIAAGGNITYHAQSEAIETPNDPLDNLINNFLRELHARTDVSFADKATTQRELKAVQQTLNSECLDIAIIRQAKRFFREQEGWLHTAGLNLINDSLIFEKLLGD